MLVTCNYLTPDWTVSSAHLYATMCPFLLSPTDIISCTAVIIAKSCRLSPGAMCQLLILSVIAIWYLLGWDLILSPSWKYYTPLGSCNTCIMCAGDQLTLGHCHNLGHCSCAWKHIFRHESWNM